MKHFSDSVKAHSSLFEDSKEQTNKMFKPDFSLNHSLLYSLKWKKQKHILFILENRYCNKDKTNMNKWIFLTVLSFSIHFFLLISKIEKIISRNRLVTFKCSHVNFFHFHRQSRKKQKEKMKEREANKLFVWFQIKIIFYFLFLFVLFVEMSTQRIFPFDFIYS